MPDFSARSRAGKLKSKELAAMVRSIFGEAAGVKVTAPFPGQVVVTLPARLATRAVRSNLKALGACSLITVDVEVAA